jgi:hypothetical protein
MEAVSTSETSVCLHETKRRSIPEGGENSHKPFITGTTCGWLLQFNAFSSSSYVLGLPSCPLENIVDVMDAVSATKGE